eukprot:965855-Rhodomonas_salina.5
MPFLPSFVLLCAALYCFLRARGGSPFDFVAVDRCVVLCFVPAVKVGKEDSMNVNFEQKGLKVALRGVTAALKDLDLKHDNGPTRLSLKPGAVLPAYARATRCPVLM